jgi:hypothetical protein
LVLTQERADRDGQRRPEDLDPDPMASIEVMKPSPSEWVAPGQQASETLLKVYSILESSPPPATMSDPKLR